MKILYICTHNRCRSILCEAITNHLAGGRLMACSAGSAPAGEVFPGTLQALQRRGIASAGLRSQSWDDFAAEQPELVVTVCDSAAAEPCPVWFGNTARAHWGLPDPSKLAEGEAQARAFDAVMDTITRRVEKLLAVDWKGLSPERRQAELDRLVGED